MAMFVKPNDNHKPNIYLQKAFNFVNNENMQSIYSSNTNAMVHGMVYMVILQPCLGPASGHQVTAKSCKISKCNFSIYIARRGPNFDQ